MAPRTKSRLVALAAVAVPAALLGAAEAVARRWPEPRPAFVLHPLLGTVRAPGYVADKISVDTGQPFRFEVNALGLRGRRLLERKKTAGTYRILFVGGSTTENPNTPEEETFPAIVEAGLSARGVRVEVGNAGVSGATSSYSLAQVAHRLVHLEPDLVVALDGINDFVDSLRDDWDPTTYEFALPRRVLIKEWLTQELRLVALLDARFGSARELDAREFFAARARLRRAKPIREPPFDVLRGVDRFRGNARRIALLCRDAGAAVAFITPPRLVKPRLTKEEEDRLTLTLVPRSPWNLEVATLARGLDAYDEALRQVAREQGALLIDASALVPREMRCFVDDAHLTRDGNAAVARVVLDALGTLPRRP